MSNGQPKGSRPDGEAADHKVVRLLEVDPDLAAGVPEDELALATRNFVAPVHELEPGPWEPAEGASASVGLLVLEGLLTRDVTFAGFSSRELLGSGDLLRPWDLADEVHPVPPESSWTVMEPTRLARLDRRLLQVGARWPQLVEAILHRTLHRSRWLAVRLAINGVQRVDQRLLLFMWHAAGRWGRVTPEGTVIPLNLTHEVLGELIGARRPSVTTALTQLREQGQLDRHGDEWLLRGGPEDVGDDAPEDERDGLAEASADPVG